MKLFPEKGNDCNDYFLKMPIKPEFIQIQKNHKWEGKKVSANVSDFSAEKK